MYGLNVSKLSTRTIHILDVTESDVSPYNKHLETIVSSNIISLILGLLSIVVGAIASWIHIKDILGGHSWGSVTRFIVNLVLSIGLIYLLACFAWYADFHRFSFLTVQLIDSKFITGFSLQPIMYQVGALGCGLWKLPVGILLD